jgi:hypothetical protein
VNDRDRRSAPLTLVRDNETDCPICGLGCAFGAAQEYDICSRCEWVDEPDAYADPGRKSECNDDSLSGAMLSWPKRLAGRLTDAPTSMFGITTRHDNIGGYDYLVDGVPIRDLFSSRVWDLKASIGPWPAPGDWFAPLISGFPSTPTGRSRLYVCHWCGGDDYEAALTADVHVRADRVIWCRIGLEDYQYGPEGWHLDVRRGPPGFAFDAEEYRRVLIDAQSSSR